MTTSQTTPNAPKPAAPVAAKSQNGQKADTPDLVALVAAIKDIKVNLPKMPKIGTTLSQVANPHFDGLLGILKAIDAGLVKPEPALISKIQDIHSAFDYFSQAGHLVRMGMNLLDPPKTDNRPQNGTDDSAIPTS